MSPESSRQKGLIFLHPVPESSPFGAGLAFRLSLTHFFSRTDLASRSTPEDFYSVLETLLWESWGLSVGGKNFP